MNQINTISTFLVVLLSSFTLAMAQTGPAPSHPNEAPELIIGQADQPILVYRNIPTKWMLNVLNVQSPCTKEGTIKVASEDCFVHTLREGRYQIEVPGKKGSIAVYLELENQVVAVETLNFETIEADTNDADFLNAHPDGAWKKHLSMHETADFGKKKVTKDTKFVLDMPSAVLQTILAGQPNRIHANRIGNCVPLVPLQIEADGASVTKLPGWNNFSIVPQKGAREVELQVWTNSRGKKGNLETVVLPVQGSK